MFSNFPSRSKRQPLTTFSFLFSAPTEKTTRMKIFAVLLVVFLFGCCVAQQQQDINDEDYDFETGNMDLKMAMDVAAVEAYNSGVWGLVIGKEVGVSLPMVCSWDRTLMRYPQPGNIAPKGTLAHVLDSEEIVLGYINTTIEAPHVDSLRPYTVLDTTHPQPTGAYTLWHVSMVQQLSVAYGKSIKITYKIYDSPGSCLRALEHEEIHMAVSPWDLSGSFGERREVMFLQGCPDHAKGNGFLWARQRDKRFNKNLSAFRAHQSDPEHHPYKIGAVNAECALYQAIYPQAEVHCKDNAAELLEGLNDHDFDVITRPFPGIKRLSGAPTAVTYYGSLYRKDDCDELM